MVVFFDWSCRKGFTPRGFCGWLLLMNDDDATNGFFLSAPVTVDAVVAMHLAPFPKALDLLVAADDGVCCIATRDDSAASVARLRFFFFFFWSRIDMTCLAVSEAGAL